MRNMIQLLGGIAAAGVVAAGATAFTGGGVILTETSESVIGGSVRQTVDGGVTVSSTDYTFLDTAGGGPTANTQLSQVVVNTAAGVPSGYKITLTPNGGTGFTGDSAAKFICVPDAERDAWTCTVKKADGTTASTGYYGNIQTLDINVVTNATVV
ncbi:hypothetical protein ACQP2E_03065 [Actinoplanes sp. CA-015351]|uniref:hypothetical protein n=1 Tax=Actinoplanes sp. CA-015351 TaxID=3239897 RepID=UPI003D966334